MLWEWDCETMIEVILGLICALGLGVAGATLFNKYKKRKIINDATHKIQEQDIKCLIDSKEVNLKKEIKNSTDGRI